MKRLIFIILLLSASMSNVVAMEPTVSSEDIRYKFIQFLDDILLEVKEIQNFQQLDRLWEQIGAEIERLVQLYDMPGQSAPSVGDEIADALKSIYLSHPIEKYVQAANALMFTKANDAILEWLNQIDIESIKQMSREQIDALVKDFHYNVRNIAYEYGMSQEELIQSNLEVLQQHLVFQMIETRLDELNK